MDKPHKDTDELIEALAGGLKPVQRMRHPLVYIAPWVVFALLYLAVSAYILGTRPDGMEKLSDPTFLFEIGIVFCLFLTATCLSAWLCVPDMRGTQWMRFVPPIFLAGICGWVGYKLIQEGLHDYSIHYGCLMDGVVMIIVPAIILVLMCQRGRTTQPLLLAGMNIIAAGALAYIGLRFTCMNDYPDHDLLHHILPWVILAGILGGFARKIFRW